MAGDIPQHPEMPNLVSQLTGLDQPRFDAMRRLGFNVTGIANEQSYAPEEIADNFYDPIVTENAATVFQNPYNNLSPYEVDPSGDPDLETNSIRLYGLLTGNEEALESANFVNFYPAQFDEDDNEYTEIPTATSNPQKPRTLAAAYDKDSMKLTVVFFDSTVYNYYAVSEDEWNDFKNAQGKNKTAGQASKGWYIKDNLDSKPRGMANLSLDIAENGNLSDETKQALLDLQAVASAAQLAKAKNKGFTAKRINARKNKTSTTPKVETFNPNKRRTKPF